MEREEGGFGSLSWKAESILLIERIRAMKNGKVLGKC